MTAKTPRYRYTVEVNSEIVHRTNDENTARSRFFKVIRSSKRGQHIVLLDNVEDIYVDSCTKS